MAQEQRWQDRIGLVLGALLFLSPWIVGYAGVTAAATSAWVIGLATVVFFAIALVKPQMWEEWVNLVLAVLLLLSPFVLGFTATTGAALSHWILGILIGADAVWALLQSRGHAHGAT